MLILSRGHYDLVVKPHSNVNLICAIQVIESDQDGTDEKAIAAMGILNTLETIVTVMESQKEILYIEGIVLDVVHLILRQNLVGK